MLRPGPLPLLAIVLSILGIAGFIFLFVRDFNIYWLILSPVIFVVYQFPAFVVFWLYKKKRDKRDARDKGDERVEEDSSEMGNQGREGEAGEEL
jgi:predicted membrane protein